MNHTPGPWEVTPFLDPTVSYSIKSKKNSNGVCELIAEIIKTGFPSRPSNGLGNPHWFTDNELAKKITLANANLIATAPELVEAIIDLFNQLDDAELHSFVLEQHGISFQKLNQVLEKATGGIV